MKPLKPDIDIPHHDHHAIRYWIDERIWGHRIWDNQTPWLIFLEFIGIAESAHREGSLLDEKGAYYPLLFDPHQRILLRNLLYNNQILPFILDRYPDDGRAWSEWMKWMQENARGVAKRDFTYLEKRFSGFRKFARLISMLRTSTVESESNRRWSSRFLFPFGASCLYEDLNITAANKISREYINEIVAPRKTLVRELSINSYQYNSQLSAQAISAFLDSIMTSDEWKAAESSSDAYPRCKAMLLESVIWPRDADDYDKAHEPGTLIKHLRQSALSRHRQHAGNVHRSYGRSIGLISKRGTNKLRYAPNDALLKALILANVADRMEFKEFLQRLFTRYGIVIGEREASQSLEETEFDNKVFQSNAVRLEQRLSSLGMLRRLSDACAYVLNPYAEATE